MGSRLSQRGNFLARGALWLRQAKILLLAPLLVTVIVAGIYWRWQVVRQTAPASAHYGLSPADIEIVPESDWIDSRVLLKKVVQDASLDDRLSLLDPKLNERISLAFRDHPWVERVERVEKFHPPRIKVTIVYRQPVAIVLGPGDLAADQVKYHAVDRNGIRLPIEDYVVDLNLLEKLAWVRHVPLKPPTEGEPWEDGRVLGAAKIADAIGPYWQKFSLLAIEPSPQPVPGSTQTYAFDLVTRGDQKIPWGRQSVGDESKTEKLSMEPTAKAKSQKLKAYVEQHGVNLDGDPVRTVSDEENYRSGEKSSPPQRGQTE
jgi:hypothetical protein